jgi:hypothetical protein
VKHVEIVADSVNQWKPELDQIPGQFNGLFLSGKLNNRSDFLCKKLLEGTANPGMTYPN